MKVTKRGLVRGALIAALVLVTLNLALLWMANRSLRRSLAQAPDLRLQLSDFAPKPIPQLDNASNYMDAAGTLCSLSPEELRSLARPTPPAGGRAAPPPTEAWREIVRRNALALQILDSGAQRPHAWFETPYDPANPVAARLPSLLQRRCVGSALRARALLAATEGRLVDAYQDVALILRLGDWCSQESPALISGLIAVALTNSGLETLEQVMSSGAPAPETRRTLAERLGAARLSDPIRRGLEGERTVQFQQAESIGRGTAQLPSAFPMLLLRFPFRFYLRLEQAASLRATTTLIARCGRPTFELERAGEAEIVVPKWLPITRIAIPSLHRAVLSRDEMRAHIDLGQIALDAEAYRQAHGAYPSAPIHGWSTAKTVDPVSGSPYVYEPLPGGFRLSGVHGRSPALSWTVSPAAAAPPDQTRAKAPNRAG